jgi:hypothetical protein
MWWQSLLLLLELAEVSFKNCFGRRYYDPFCAYTLLMVHIGTFVII